MEAGNTKNLSLVQWQARRGSGASPSSELTLLPSLLRTLIWRLQRENMVAKKAMFLYRVFLLAVINILPDTITNGTHGIVGSILRLRSI